MINKHTMKFPKRACIVIGFIILLELVATGISFWYRSLDSDLATEIVFAKQLISNNLHYSSDWYPTTDMPFRGQTNVIIVGIYLVCGLFNYVPSYHFIFMLTSVISMIIIAVALNYYYNKLSTNITQRLMGIAIFLIPLGPLWDISSIYYGTYVTICFIMLGIYLDYIKQDHTDRKTIFKFFILSLLCFYAGFSGIRYFLIFYIPLFLHEFIFTRSFSKNLNIKSFKCMTIMLLSSIIGHVVLGLMLNRMLPVDYGNYINGRGYLLKAISVDTVWICIQWFGLDKYISKEILAVFMILLVCLLFLFCYLVYKKKYSKNSNEVNTKDKKQLNRVLVFGFCQLFVTLVLSIGTGFGRQRYIALSAMTLISLVPLISELPVFSKSEVFAKIRTRKMKIAFCILMVCLSLTSLISSILCIDSNINRDGYISYLIDNNLENGMATYWNANVTNVLTDGDTKIKSIKAEKSFPENRFGELKSIAELPSDYMLLTNDEFENLYSPDIEFNNVVYKDDNYYILTK